MKLYWFDRRTDILYINRPVYISDVEYITSTVAQAEEVTVYVPPMNLIKPSSSYYPLTTEGRVVLTDRNIRYIHKDLWLQRCYLPEVFRALALEGMDFNLTLITSEVGRHTLATCSKVSLVYGLAAGTSMESDEDSYVEIASYSELLNL